MDLVGRKIANRYHVVSFVGRGGMADVYKVMDSQRGTFLAMKVLHPDLAEDRAFVRRFQREADLLEKLQHPNIVRFYGIEQTDSLVFILMEYIEGTTLRKEIFRADGQPMPGWRIGQVMRALCSALHYAHQNGIVHCDIKPANILMDRSGRILVSDFGISRMADTATTTTMVGAGTPAYMAPEQISGHHPTPQTDIYSLGVLLYEMATGGNRPFRGEMATIAGTTAEKVRWEHMHLQPEALHLSNPQVSAELEGVVRTCLEKNPTARFDHSLALLNALSVTREANEAVPANSEKLFQRLLDPPAPETVVGANAFSQPPAPKRRFPIWALGGLVFAGLAGGVMLVIALWLGLFNGKNDPVASRLPVNQPQAAAQFTQPAQAQATQEPQPNPVIPPTEALLPTQVIPPTYTPQPTYTPYPTSTPIPDTPVPTVVPRPQSANVLWDISHTPRQGNSGFYQPDDMFKDVSSLLAGEHISITTGRTNVDTKDLSSYDVIVVCATCSVGSLYTASEARAIGDFVENGGGLVILSEDSGFEPKTIYPVANYFGVDIALTNGVDTFSPSGHPIFSGVSEVYFYNGSVVRKDSSQSEVLAFEYGQGRVVVVGDSNLFDNRWLSRSSNEIFAVNVFQWVSFMMD